MFCRQKKMLHIQRLGSSLSHEALVSGAREDIGNKSPSYKGTTGTGRLLKREQLHELKRTYDE